MTTRPLRTAVLCVHGMGSQRPPDTVRGIVNAVWFDDDDHTKNGKKLWSHPQPSGVDLDLTVMTTSPLNGAPGTRVADFHELYWAHHMSETKAVAVLLWLFELGRRGPYFKTGMNGLWWCGAVYLCLLLLSVALVSLRGIVWLAEAVDQPEGIAITLFLMIGIALVGSLIAAAIVRWRRLLGRLVLGAVIWAGLAALCVGMAWLLAKWANLYLPPEDGLTTAGAGEILANVLLPIGSAFIAAKLLMGRWGVKAFGWTLLLSIGFFAIYIALAHLDAFDDETLVTALSEGRVPWSLASDWSVIAAWIIIGIYLIINALFLQPYLGDAARYFRNSPANVAVRRAIRKDAVDTLDQLHRSRDYDRIIVVAHSLGTAVAYDMLRAYYSRVCDQIPVDRTKLNPEFDSIDHGTLDCESLRRLGRKLVAKFAAGSGILADDQRKGHYQPAASADVDAWLVTDFVTLGSPLTHARYLMVNENDGEKIEEEFWNRVRERELPLCPPAKQNGDGLLSFTHDGKVRLHHGGMFALMRWTNLYFPVLDIFWGDAIGGPVAPVFGGCVKDVPVWTNKARFMDGFKHTAYWTTDCAPDRRDAPHIVKLREAVNLLDT